MTLYCNLCDQPIRFDDEYVSERTGKKIPLDYDTEERHHCEVWRWQQKQRYKPRDHNDTIEESSTYDPTPVNGISLEEWWQNERQKINPLDPSFFSDPAYQCYYCDDYYSDVFDKDCKTRYEDHMLVRHGNSHPYPNKAEIEKLGLKPQGKEWEV
jgi:hypothetical protein